MYDYDGIGISNLVKRLQRDREAYEQRQDISIMADFKLLNESRFQEQFNFGLKSIINNSGLNIDIQKK